MDIEANPTSTKERKGSCSTLESLSSDLSSPDPETRDSLKHKKVRKVGKLKKSTSMGTPSQTSTAQDPTQQLIRENRARILSLVKQITK